MEVGARAQPPLDLTFRLCSRQSTLYNTISNESGKYHRPSSTNEQLPPEEEGDGIEVAWGKLGHSLAWPS